MKALPNRFYATAGLGLVAWVQAGAATNLVDSAVATSRKLDAGALTISGSLHDTNGNSQPWTAQVYAQQGECLRLFVTSSNFDAMMVVISPDHQAYRDDDSGGLLRPLVEIGTAPAFGWYTVQVANYNAEPITADFTMKYGRYNNGNPNCANPTQPFAETRSGPKEIDAVAPATPRDANAP